jgi:MFS family permease
MDRFPKATRYIVGAAFLSSVPAMVLLRFVKENSVGHKVLLCVLLTVVGIFTSVALPAFFADVINVVKQKDLQSPDVFGQGGAVALGVGLANIGFAMGSIVGPFFAGFIRQDAGWDTMGWALGVLAGVTTLPTVLLTGGWIRSLRPRSLMILDGGSTRA